MLFWKYDIGEALTSHKHYYSTVNNDCKPLLIKLIIILKLKR